MGEERWAPLPEEVERASSPRIPWSWALAAAFAAGAIGAAADVGRLDRDVAPFAPSGLIATSVWLKWARVQAPLAATAAVAGLGAWRAGSPAVPPAGRELAGLVLRGLAGWPFALVGAAAVLIGHGLWTHTPPERMTTFVAVSDVAAGGLDAVAGAAAFAVLWRPWLRSSAGSTAVARGVVTWILAAAVGVVVRMAVEGLVEAAS